MFASDSRYARQPVLEHVQPRGVAVRYVLPRLLPDPDDNPVVIHERASDSDRIDLLAYRHLGASTAWWAIADANRVVDPQGVPGPVGSGFAVPVPGAGRFGG